MGSSFNVSLGNSMKKCGKCRKRKEDYEFHKRNSSVDNLQAVCKSCRKRNPRTIASTILTGMKNRSVKKGFVDPEFSVDEIEDILIKGKCEVTKRHFNYRNITKYKFNPFVASPDRINNKKGYTKNNVRWVMSWVNMARGVYDIDFFAKLIRGVKWK